MPRRYLLFLLLLVPVVVSAQPRTKMASPEDLVPVPSIQTNSISNMHVQGDTLWIGPYLNLTTNEGETWQIADADSLFNSRNRLFSIDIEGPVIWAGLGTTLSMEGVTAQSAAGFLVSHDGGQTFEYRFPPLDAVTDTTVSYGVNRLTATPVTVPQQSPPYDVDYDPSTGTVWVAAWASGIRRSSDDGRTWQRVVLPPDNLETISPDQEYDFQLNPLGGQPNGNYNHTGFSVLVDEAGVVWAGTPAGVNRSTDGGSSWQRFYNKGSATGLTGDWVLSIEEQPVPGRNPIWMATLVSGRQGASQTEQSGVTVTRDGGETFDQVLLGERVIDFAFRGDTMYAAGRESGLFITADGGVSWTSVTQFRDKNRPDRFVRPNVDVTSVAVTSDALWVGTDDGLLKSTDGGRTWVVIRADVPLHPDEPSERVPVVDTYAYPNPFSPAADRFIRIRFEAAGGQNPEIRIYDFGMSLIRELPVDVYGTGDVEVTWDGTNDDGLRVANGPYFYAVRKGDETTWGKILVIE